MTEKSQRKMSAEDAPLPMTISFPGEMKLDLFLADQLIDRHGFLETAPDAIDGIGDAGNGLVLCLGELQHLCELFSLAARRGSHKLEAPDHVQALARSVVGQALALGRNGVALLLLVGDTRARTMVFMAQAAF